MTQALEGWREACHRQITWQGGQLQRRTACPFCRSLPGHSRNIAWKDCMRRDNSRQADILDESNTLYLRTARRFRATAPHFIWLDVRKSLYRKIMYHTSLKGITSFPCICLLCSVLPLPPSAFRAHTCIRSACQG